ncbi:MAG TPA: hypothetical protein VKZ94_14790, partial [Advenella sp.]|nr:hypothetical protein [Advenella sp.]
LDMNHKSFNVAAMKVSPRDGHFHYLRRRRASWCAPVGTPLFVLKESGGWESLEMVKKACAYGC